MSAAEAEILEFPASENQLQLWLEEATAEVGSSYNISAGFRVSGVLDLALLQAALDHVVRRHEALRTTLVERDGALCQRVLSQVDVPIQELGESGSSVAIEAVAERPFDLGRGPLIRVAVQPTSSDERLLVLALHHLIADGWSLGLIVAELFEAHRRLCAGERPELPEVHLQFPDFVLWAAESDDEHARAARRRFWAEALADVPAELELPRARPRPPERDRRARSMQIELGPQLTRALEDLAVRRGTTLNLVVLAAFEVLLARYSGQELFALGTVSARREDSEFATTVGFLANLLPVRADLRGDPTFEEHLARVRDHAVAALTHQNISLPEMLTELGVPRVPGVPPLIQVSFQLLYQDFEPALMSIESQWSPVTLASGSSPLELVVTAARTDELRLNFLWATAIYDEADIAAMAANFQTLLAGVAATPTQSIRRLPLVTASEINQLLAWSTSDDSAPR